MTPREILSAAGLLVLTVAGAWLAGDLLARAALLALRGLD